MQTHSHKKKGILLIYAGILSLFESGPGPKPIVVYIYIWAATMTVGTTRYVIRRIVCAMLSIPDSYLVAGDCVIVGLKWDPPRS